MFIHVYVVLIPLLLLLSAIFAATEASLFSLSRTQLEAMRESRPALYRSIRTLIQQPDSFLSTLIIGNECVNIFIGTFVASLLEFHFHHWGPRLLMLVAVLISSTLVLTCSEILPKILAFRIPVLAASFLIYPATWLHSLLTPLRKVFLFVSSQILKLLHIRSTPQAALTEKEFLTLVDVGAESGSLDREETEMIYNVFHFSDMPVSSVMTPWKDVFKLPGDLPVSEVLNRVRQKTFSRIPLVSGKEERVVGVLYTKELLKLCLGAKQFDPTRVLEEATFPPYIVSTHKKISKLFREFKLKKVHMALVVDEYGRHLGVVTLEDVLNALFRTHPQSKEATAP